MASALVSARAQLKDIKPPLTDAEIQDSLWHYWFDVDKTVSWLRKEWEKKGTYQFCFCSVLPHPSPSPLLSSLCASVCESVSLFLVPLAPSSRPEQQLGHENSSSPPLFHVHVRPRVRD